MLDIIIVLGATIAFTAILAALADSTDFVFIPGGSFQPGGPKNEPGSRSAKAVHSVAVSSFLICTHEVTQSEYETVMGMKPGAVPDGEQPAKGVSWHDAIAYCNARSEAEGLTPAYWMDGQRVIWDRSADGYRLPTQAEWAYIGRGGAEQRPYSGLMDMHGSIREWVWDGRGEYDVPATGSPGGVGWLSSGPQCGGRSPGVRRIPIASSDEQSYERMNEL